MNSTGIVRKFDHLGRIVVPAEMRRTLGIKEGDPIDISLVGKQVVLKKHLTGCMICGDVDAKLVSHGEIALCLDCINKLVERSRASGV